MTLGEHFREFRRRLFIAAASVLVASLVEPVVVPGSVAVSSRSSSS